MHGTSNDFTFLYLLWLLIMSAVSAAITTSSFTATKPVHVSATSSNNEFLTTMSNENIDTFYSFIRNMNM